MRGDGPVGEAQYRCGPLLGHQVAEGGEESPQPRGLRRPFRGMYCRLCCLHRQIRRRTCSVDRTGCSAGRTGSRAANSLMRPGARWEGSRGILRGRRAGPRPLSAVPWRLSDSQPFTNRS